MQPQLIISYTTAVPERAVPWATVWTAIAAIGTIGAALFAGVSALLARRALGANARALSLQARAIDLQTFESIFKEIRSFDRVDRQYEPEFFNTLEYLSFLINHKVVETAHLQAFFKPAMLHWYETALDLKDRDKFIEFTRLYHKLKAEE